MGIKEVAAARGTLGRDPDPGGGEPDALERELDRSRQIEGIAPLRVGFQEKRRKAAGHLGSNGVTTGMDARSHNGTNLVRGESLAGESFHGSEADSVQSASPSRVKERPARAVPGDEGDGGAVRHADGDPRVAGFDKESVRGGARFGRGYDPHSVDLAHAPRLVRLHPFGGPDPASIFENRPFAIPDPEPHVERGVRPFALASDPGCHPEESPLGERAHRRRPEDRRVHGSHFAAARALAQAGCLLLLIAAGCARVPVMSSGTRARAHFLETFAKREDATRGAGALSLRHGDSRDGTLEVRWATEAESLVVVGYVGPVRALDATFLGDSLFVGLRPLDLGLAGPVVREEGLGPMGLRFMARPWNFSPDWIRSAIEHGTIEAWGDGWRVAGVLVGESTHPFGLELNAKGEPTRLRIGAAEGRESLITIRYGPSRAYRGGTLPRFVEWERGPSTVRLEIDEYSRPNPSRLRHSPPADPEWTMLSLNDPRSRELLRRFLGIGAEDSEP